MNKIIKKKELKGMRKNRKKIKNEKIRKNK